MKFPLLLILSALLALSCGGSKKPAPQAAAPVALASMPEFVADSAMQFVIEQCAFGARVPNTPAHQHCADYIAGRFHAYGAEVTLQRAGLRAYDGTTLNACNIIASLRTELTDRILLCGHWDSRPWADNDPDPANHRTPVIAANDGASPIAVMLEMARIMQQTPPPVGIDFVCFDAEDYGIPQWDEGNYTAEEREAAWCLGSQYWAEQAYLSGYQARYGILMDMVGGRGTTFSPEGFSLHYAEPLVNRVWDFAAQLGHADLFPRTPGGYITDDHVPVNRIARIPCINIVPYVEHDLSNFGPTWHTVNDTPEHIDPAVLRAVGRTVLQLIYSEKPQTQTQ